MDVFKIAQVNFFSPGEKLDISTFFNIMYQKFVANDGGASILDFKFSPASVIPGDIYGSGISPDTGYYLTVLFKNNHVDL